MFMGVWPRGDSAIVCAQGAGWAEDDGGEDGGARALRLAECLQQFTNFRGHLHMVHRSRRGGAVCGAVKLMQLLLGALQE